MGARSSRLQEESLCGALGKDGGVKRESLRRIRGSRPSSLALQFSTGFERDSEPTRSRSDSDTGRRGAPAETGTERGVEPESGNGEDGPVSPERLSQDPTGSGALRDRGSSGGLTAARRLPSGRSSARAARARTAGPLPEAWIGLYRVRHCMRCPVCNRPFPEGRIEEHLLTCLTSPSLPYNTDVLSKDTGECSICLEELLQGDTIARLACLCVYHKKCIDSWSSVKPCCPEHPFD